MKRLIGGLAAGGWLALGMPAFAQCLPGQTVVEAGFGGKICQGQPRVSTPAPVPRRAPTVYQNSPGTNAAAAIFGGLAAGGILLDALRPSARDVQEPSSEPDRNDYDREARRQHTRALGLLRSGGDCYDAWLTFGVAEDFFTKAGNGRNAAIASRNKAVAFACKAAQGARKWAAKDEYSLAAKEYGEAASLYDALGMHDSAAYYRKLGNLAQAREDFRLGLSEAESPDGYERALERFKEAAQRFSQNGDPQNAEIARGNTDRVARLIQAEKAAEAEAEARERAREAAEEAARKAALEDARRRADNARASAAAKARAAEQANREIQEQAARERDAEARASSRNPYGDGGRFSEASEENLYYDSACEPNVYCDRVYRDGRSSPPPRKVNAPAPAPVQQTPPLDAATVKARRDEMVRTYLERLKSQDQGENHGDVLKQVQQAYDEASNR